MCLGIPARVLAITDDPLPMTTVDVAGQKRQHSAMCVPKLVVGSWVFVQNGLIMNIPDKQETKESLAATEEYNLTEHVAEVFPKGRT